jgi:chromosome segregation ATPase
MIEPIMYIGIGFIAAALLVLGTIPLVHARAVRLTMRRLEALTPLSMAEIQADKDQLRAEFAMSTRRLEMSVEQMKAKATSQLTDIGKKSEAIGRLKLELGEKTAALFALEAKDKQLEDEVAGLRGELTSTTGTLEEHQRTLAGTQATLAQINTDFHHTSTTSDTQRVELAALRAQAEALKGQIEAADKEAKELRQKLARKTSEAETSGMQLAEERIKAEQLAGRVAELDRQLIVQTTEAEVINRRVHELTAKLDQHGRSLVDRDDHAERLRLEAVSAQQVEADIRSALADAEKVHRATTDAMKAEKSKVEEQLAQSRSERTKLEAEIVQMKRDAETAWTNERMENAVLRERINDVAAEVARLTAVLEGPSSPIHAILAGETRPANGGSPPIVPAGGTEPKGSLADRIRALQARAAAAAPTT